MAGKMVSIEIGERLIKVCETTAGATAKVSACFMFQTPQETVADGEIKDAEAVAQVIGDNLQKHGVKEKKVLFTIASGRIATREVTVPPVKETRIKAIVEANASDYFPVDMTKYHITYALQERITLGEDAGDRLIVMAAPVAILEGYFRIAELLGLQVAAIDYWGNSQLRLLERMPSDEMTVYVDVGCTFSGVTVMKSGKQLLQRTFSSGVDDLVESYISYGGGGSADYAAALSELSGEKMTEETYKALKDDFDENMQRLVGNITRIVDYFNSSNWETPVEKLVLTGVGAHVRGLREAVAEASGLPVTVLTDLDKVSAPQENATALCDYISCVGCVFSPVDFIPEQFGKAKKRENRLANLNIGVLVFAVCAAGAIILSAVSLIGYASALSREKSLEAKTAQLAYTENEYKTYLSYNKYAEDMSNLEKIENTPNAQLLAFINDLETKMPSQVDILSATCTDTGISMNITVATKEAAAEAVVQLRTFKSIRDIDVGQLTEAKNTGGAAQFSFSVTCKYDYTPYAVPSDNPVNKAKAAQSAPAAPGGTKAASGSTDEIK